LYPPTLVIDEASKIDRTLFGGLPPFEFVVSTLRKAGDYCLKYRCFANAIPGGKEGEGGMWVESKR